MAFSLSKLPAERRAMALQNLATSLRRREREIARAMRRLEQLNQAQAHAREITETLLRAAAPAEKLPAQPTGIQRHHITKGDIRNTIARAKAALERGDNAELRDLLSAITHGVRVAKKRIERETPAQREAREREIAADAARREQARAIRVARESAQRAEQSSKYHGK